METLVLTGESGNSSLRMRLNIFMLFTTLSKLAPILIFSNVSLSAASTEKTIVRGALMESHSLAIFSVNVMALVLNLISKMPFSWQYFNISEKRGLSVGSPLPANTTAQQLSAAASSMTLVNKSHFMSLTDDAL